MKERLTIKIPRRTQPEICIWFVVIMPFMFGILFDFFHLPSSLKYIIDVSWLFLLVLILLNLKKCSENVLKNKALFIWCLAFLIFTMIGYIFNYQSIFYYIWGIRNNFRYYVVFLACIMFLRIGDVSKYFKLLDFLFWINVVICLVQYFVFNVYGDWLGGIFGTTVGCNAYTNMFFVIISIKTIIFALNKKEKIMSCIAKFAAMFVIAAFAEIKFFYIIFILIIGLAVIFTDFSWRKFAIVITGLGGLIAGAYILTIVFPGSVGFLSLDSMYNYAASQNGYTASGDINRLTAVPIISKSFLTDNFSRFFGLGLGNCDTASVDIFKTPFHARYSYMNYDWFSLAFMFLETGYLGLMLFWGFFVVAFILAKKKKYVSADTKMYAQISAILAVCCILISLYNSTLRFEAGYMAYFVLSFPFLKPARVQEKVTPQEQEKSPEQVNLQEQIKSQ